jgi:hypothetical protein
MIIKQELEEYILSIPRITVEEALNLVSNFDREKGTVESYVPGYGKLKIRLQKDNDSLVLSLSESRHFQGSTEFIVSNPRISQGENGLRVISFGEDTFSAEFEALVFLQGEE